MSTFTNVRATPSDGRSSGSNSSIHNDQDWVDLKISPICRQIDDTELLLSGNVNYIADEPNNVGFEGKIMVPATIARTLDSHANNAVQSVKTEANKNFRHGLTYK